MNKTEGAIQAIMHAQDFVANNPDQFHKIDIPAYIADYTTHFYNQEPQPFPIDEYEFDEALATYKTDTTNNWHIGQYLGYGIDFLNIIEIEQGLYFRYREYYAYKSAVQRNLTEAEIKQFLCTNDDYAQRTLPNHTEYNYPLFVYGYEIHGTLHFVANIPGYPGICGDGTTPQQAVENAYAILKQHLQ